MEVQRMERFFEYGQLRLSDPDPGMTPEQVRDFYAAVYPELAQAVVGEPERRGATQVYKITRAVGTKGGEPSPPHLHMQCSVLLTVEQLAEISEAGLEEEKGGACPHDILTRFLGTIQRDSERMPQEGPLPGRFLPLLH
ncbi:PRTRC system protein C [Candidatus Manganitrophus noduliformans]|uniref:PRTRC system protein C n=1 Tax=Candidatus Manganitrophus noduliformans TaxID=2606439 RepID=A0A7X6DN86_9BACT|nr:PRTRC system protein C [Candidatus Manganitrophus noduliformans]NKE70222.1 PRTRC system protein C [Candidatus Manganitrophus noduliformans]